MGEFNKKCEFYMLFNRLHFVPNLYDFFSSVYHNRRGFVKCSCCFFHAIKLYSDYIVNIINVVHIT